EFLAVAVGHEIDAFTDPHRLVVGGAVVSEPLRRVVDQIIGPHVLCAATAIALPAAEVAVDGRVDIGIAVRAEHAAAGHRHLQRGFHAAVHRHPVGTAFALAGPATVGAHQHGLAIREPVQHAVIGAT